MRMEEVEEFDAVIVYDGFIAEGASDTEYTEQSPFSKNGGHYSYNECYEYFLGYCKTIGLRAAFVSTYDITDSGKFSAVWVYNKKWQLINKTASTKIIFDKFSNLETYNAKFNTKLRSNNNEYIFFHNQRIREVFDNKLKTYKTFTEFAIPTVKISVESGVGIIAAKEKLHNKMIVHEYPGDFTDSYVLKDQYGAGGANVFKVTNDTKLQSIGNRDISILYILQPLITASGFKFSKLRGNIDLRVIVCSGKITQCYIRIPKPGEFKANASSGSTVVYVPLTNIPKGVLRMAKNINDQLPVNDGFYALDFIKSSTGHIYFIKGNITPGLIWFNDEDEVYAKELMRLIIDNLALRISNIAKSSKIVP